MAFLQKTWKDRVAEYINRRVLTKEDGTTELVSVERSEGTISQEGDAFSAANMNDLEQRIANEFSEQNKNLNMRYNPETDMVEIFYNGVWNAWEVGNMQNLFAYNYGNENTAITGGWSGYAYKDSGSGSSVKLPTVTKESNRMKIGSTGTSSSWYFGSVFAEKPIDLTNYKTIEIVVGTANLNSNTGGGGFSVTKTKANNYANAKLVNITGTGTYTLDVSSLSGSHYLCLSVRAGASTAEQYYYISSVKLIK